MSLLSQQFGDVTYSMLSVVGDIAMLGASYIYGAYLGSTPLRKLFIGLQVLNIFASTFDLALALHLHERLGTCKPLLPVLYIHAGRLIDLSLSLSLSLFDCRYISGGIRRHG